MDSSCKTRSVTTLLGYLIVFFAVPNMSALGAPLVGTSIMLHSIAAFVILSDFSEIVKEKTLATVWVDNVSGGPTIATQAQGEMVLIVVWMFSSRLASTMVTDRNLLSQAIRVSCILPSQQISHSCI